MRSLILAICLSAPVAAQSPIQKAPQPQQKPIIEYQSRVMFVPLGPLRRCFWQHRYRKAERQWLRLNGGSYVPQEAQVTIRPIQPLR